MSTYNGWTNYETWNVKLWIDNEEGSSRYWDDVAEQCLENNITKEGDDGTGKHHTRWRGKTRQIKVSYRLTVTEQEWKDLQAVAKEHGYDYDNPTPLKLVKRLLQSTGTGSLAYKPQHP